MKLDLRSCLVGAAVVALLWVAFAGSRSLALDRTPRYYGEGTKPIFQIAVGPDGTVFVASTITGEVRRVFRDGEQWRSELVVPRGREYWTKPTVTSPQ